MGEAGVLDEDDRVEAYRSPHEDKYADIHQYVRDQSVPVQSLSALNPLSVDTILGDTN